MKNCTYVILGVVLAATIHRKERKKVRKKVDLKHKSNNNNTAQYFDGTYIGRYGSTHVLGGNGHLIEFHLTESVDRKFLII